jgi:V/A-type H+-transporting ATPase subunit I
MSRTSIIVLEHDERDVLRCLGRMGLLQLTRAPAGPDSAPLPPPDHGPELARCNRLDTRIQELCRSLEIKNFPDLKNGTEMSLPKAGEELVQLERPADELARKRQDIAFQAGKLAETTGQLSDFYGLGIPLDRPEESAYLHFVTGTLPAKNFDRLQGEIGDKVALVSMPEREGRLPVMAMTLREGRPALEVKLRQAGFQPTTLPVAEGATVDTLSDENRHEQERLSAKLLRLDIERAKLAERAALPLAQIEFAVETERRLLEAGQQFPRTESTVQITGWIPRSETTLLEKKLREITNDRCAIQIMAPLDSNEEEIPVLLRHPRWLRPFEMLVTAYGLPHYRELEPTLFVAVSYVLMFGMMFGDVGHGAVLALGGLATLLAGRKQQIRNVGQLLMFGGGSSMIFGALYGSCFGIAAFKKFALWHDPLEGNPMSLMSGAIGIGMAMISLGLVLNIVNRFRHGDFIGGLLGKFGVAGAVFYWGALALVTKYAAVQASGWIVPVIIVVLALPILGWMLKEPLELFLRRRAGKSLEPGSSMVAAFSESFVGAFEGVLGYFANTISFVRLAAYAMSHAALLLAAFLMADALKHVPVAGSSLSVLVIILGNAVAIALEGIVASVQALRLEYYEFFGKFFSGGGQPFKPFRLQTKTVAEAPL